MTTELGARRPPQGGADGDDHDRLTALFDPRSLAVVGASNDPAKWGNWIALNALRGVHRRDVFLINKRGGEVAGHPVSTSLTDLPVTPELVVLVVPEASFEAAVDDALAAGSRMLVAITAGFGELGDAGRERQARIVAKVREAGSRLLGPNCMGLTDAGAELFLASSVSEMGPVGLISQSGNLGIELGLLLEREGLGFSRLVSLGNQADIEAEEVLESLVDHAETRTILLYLEGIRDGRRLVAAARRAHAAGKPVVLIAAGASEAAVRAARSHTGALVTGAAVVEAACRAGGIVEVASPRQAVAAIQVLLPRVRPRGPRLGIVADGGGHGVLAADVATAAGLTVPQLRPATATALAAGLPPTASTSNPVDLAGGGEQDFSSYGRMVDLLLASGEVDTVLLSGFFGGYSVKSDELGRRELAAAALMADARDGRERPLLVHSMHHAAMPNDALRQREIPVFAAVEDAVEALARAVHWRSLPSEPLPLPPPAPPVAGDDYWSARTLLEEAGLPVARAQLLAPNAPPDTTGLTYPVVVKALGLRHKSDAGGVVLGILDDAALANAVADVRARLAPPAIVVEEQVPLADGVELIVGCRHDPSFGLLLLVGFGGIYAEILQDTAIALGPVDMEVAAAMIRSLRGASLLVGARNRPPLDLNGAAAFAARLSALAGVHPEIAEVEVNPLLVLPERVVALDARVVLGGDFSLRSW
jgi:acyl-CoA synthetase (NDP forming)